MIKDKEEKNVSLTEILKHLTGTDINDDAKSVIDFAVYKVKEDNTLCDPDYYLIAAEAIVTQVSFVGPFTMVEIDFRNIGTELLNQVVNVVHKFHNDINSENMIMISTLTSLEENSTHIMSLIDPLICVRGYSIEGNSSTLMQLVYSTENIAFSVNEIDFKSINAEIERDLYEQESMIITQQTSEAGQYDETSAHDTEMQDMFHPDFVPDFNVRTSEDRIKDNNDVRISGNQKKDKNKNVRIGGEDNNRITGDENDEEEDVIR